MSLYLGNLSSRIRRDELERVFGRFGHCTVQVKDKFGFVIYGYRANAEKALRTLRGKKICGERITVSWSNRQPRPFQRYSRSGRNHEPPQGRHFAREDYARRKLGSDVREGHRRAYWDIDVGSPELIDGPKGHRRNIEDYAGKLPHDIVQDLPSEGGADRKNILENDRWEDELEGMDFERYEPYCDDDEKVQEDIHISPHLACSPPVRKSQDKPEHVDQLIFDHPKKSKPGKSCYACGEVGHRMRKCPQQLKIVETRSRKRLRLDRVVASTKLHNNHAEASTSKNRGRLMGHGGSSKARLISKEMEKDYKGKKQSRKEYGTPEKARVPVSSSIHSDYTASGSRARSRSRRSVSGPCTRSRSKSLSLRKNSMSSRSKSGSTSSYPGTKKIKSQTISKSSSPTSLSLSASLGRPLPSSPNRVQMDHKDFLVDSSGFIVKDFVENERSQAPIEPENNAKSRDFVWRGDAHNHSSMGDLCETKKFCLPQSQHSEQNAGNFASNTVPEFNEFNSVDFLKEDKLILMNNSAIEASGRPHATSLLSISSKEMGMVLKNSGLGCSGEIEEDLPPESYFGSARLWPWELIYYRRLKKGPISKDNYARRLSQNEEFGIVDKYIRSSSGWGELTNENP